MASFQYHFLVFFFPFKYSKNKKVLWLKSRGKHVQIYKWMSFFSIVWFLFHLEKKTFEPVWLFRLIISIFPFSFHIHLLFPSFHPFIPITRRLHLFGCGSKGLSMIIRPFTCSYTRKFKNLTVSYWLHDLLAVLSSCEFQMMLSNVSMVANVPDR